MASYRDGVTLTREQAAQVLYQAGIRGESLVFLTAVAERESGYVAGAHRTDSPRDRLSGDRGLWQINSVWDAQLRDAGIISNPRDLFDPLTNAKAAAFVLAKQGKAAWGMGSNGWAAGGDPNKGINLSAAQAAVDRAASQGMLGKDYAANTSTGGGTTAGLPKDARLVEVPGVARYAMFQIMPGVWIRYAITADSGINTAGRHFTRLSRQEWAKTFGDSVQGGNASELAEIPTAFGTYQAYTNAILDQLFPKGDPRRSDPEVLRVVATRAGRPDMTEAEFENLLKATQYYQTRTEGQLRWNDLSEAERQAQREDMKARMNQAWMSHVGRNMPTGANHDWMVEQLASGKMGFGQWTETVLKPTALGVAESPWARQVRDEKENQLQRPIDIENTMLRVRETAAEWGVPMSEATLRNWATGLVANTKSDDDLMTYVKKQAQIMYPTKDPELSTNVWAAPWIETYNRVLERQGSIRTPEIAKALWHQKHDPDNYDPWSFEQKLKMTDDYDQTRQGADDAWSTTGELAGMLGF